MSFKPTQQVSQSDRVHRDFHIAGDGRPLPGYDAKKQVGDYIVTWDFSRVYKVTQVADDGHSGITRMRVDGLEADGVIHAAKRLLDTMQQHERLKQQEQDTGLILTQEHVSAEMARLRVEELKRRKVFRADK